MKKQILSLLTLLTFSFSFSQFEIGAGYASVAASDGFDAVSAGAFQLDADYDFASESKLRLALGTNVLFGSGGTAFSPGIKVGLDYINAKINFDSDGIIWYGLGGRIPLGDTHGISLSLQGARVDDIGLGWGSIGYSYRF